MGRLVAGNRRRRPWRLSARFVSDRRGGVRSFLAGTFLDVRVLRLGGRPSIFLPGEPTPCLPSWHSPWPCYIDGARYAAVLEADQAYFAVTAQFRNRTLATPAIFLFLLGAMVATLSVLSRRVREALETSAHLPEHVRDSRVLGSPVVFALPEVGVSLEDLERNLLSQALERAGNNKTRAAQLFGISRRAAYPEGKTRGMAGAEDGE